MTAADRGSTHNASTLAGHAGPVNMAHDVIQLPARSKKRKKGSGSTQNEDDASAGRLFEKAARAPLQVRLGCCAHAILPLASAQPCVISTRTVSCCTVGTCLHISLHLRHWQPHRAAAWLSVPSTRLAVCGCRDASVGG